MAIIEEIKNSTAVRVYRQGWLAWLGAHKTAFDYAQDGVSKLVNGREELVEELVQKGEEVEGMAQGNIDKVRGYVEPRINEATARFSEVGEKVADVRSKVIARVTPESTDRVEELSTEVAKLAKSVTALSRKVNSAAKPAAKKAAVKRPVAKKVTAKKPVAKKVAPKTTAKTATKAAPTVEAPKASDTKVAA